MAINLQKGQKIDLTKHNGERLTDFCVGVNWGMIEKSTFFGPKKIAVDLDASCAMFDANNQLLDVVYFGQLTSRDQSIRHSGDDRQGDDNGDDGLDNEILSVNLPRVSPQVDKIVFFLNSYNQQDFGDIPFASARLYEGTPTRVKEIYATYNVANDISFQGSVSMILGKLYRHNGAWKFAAIGVPTKDRTLAETVSTIACKFL